MRYFKQTGLSALASVISVLLSVPLTLLLTKLGIMNPWSAAWQAAVWHAAFIFFTLTLNFLAGWRFGRALPGAGFWIQPIVPLLASALILFGKSSLSYFAGSVFNALHTDFESVIQQSGLSDSWYLQQAAAAVLSALLPTGCMFLGMCTARRKKSRQRNTAASRSECSGSV